MTELPDHEGWDCPTCFRPTPPSEDYKCGTCEMLASHHLSATQLCKRLRAAQNREASLIVENKRLQGQLDEIGKLVKQMKFDSSYRISNWPFDLEPLESADHDNDSPTYQ
jgi:hypothetical protein